MAKKINTDKLAGGLGLFSTLLGTAKQASQLENVEQYENDISSFNDDFTIGSLDSLQSQFTGTARENYSINDVMPTNLGKNIFNAGIEGAVAGVSTTKSPWGLLGAVPAIVEGFRTPFKAERQVADLNNKALLANKSLLNNYATIAEQSQNKMYNNTLLNMASDGGKIYIKPENRGKFTSLKKRTGKSASWFKEHGTPAQKKMATFALNAAKWKHSYGGPLFDNSGDFSNGLMFINAGGTHEENPFEGVQIGVDTQGIPNLVEEGEVIWNDYVFSNRLKPTKKQLADNGFKDKYQDWTFAKIVEDLQKESANLPHDFISQNTLEDMMNSMLTLQEEVREKQSIKKSNKEVNRFDRGSYITNVSPISSGLDFSGATRRKEELSSDIKTLFDSYNYGELDDWLSGIANTELSLDEEDSTQRDKFKLPTTREMIQKSLSDVPWWQNAMILSSDSISDIKDTITKEDEEDPSIKDNALRYAPAITNAIGLLHNILETPDYTNAIAGLREMRKTPSASFTPIGGKQAYVPVDTNYLTNRQTNLARAVARDYQNQSVSGAQAMANLANLNYNTQNAIGQTLLEASRENQARKLQAAQFNLEIDQFNAQKDLRTQQLNQQRMYNIAQAAANAGQLREAIDAQRAQAISASLTGIGDDLGNIGRERMDRQLLERLIESGALSWSANGGKINRKKRRLT